MPRDWAGIFLVGIGFCCARAACDAIMAVAASNNSRRLIG
jgi:hypothetical protein